MILGQKWSTEEALKEIEKNIRKRLDEEVEQIRNDPFPAPKELYTEIGTTPGHYIRGVNIETSIPNPEQ